MDLKLHCRYDQLVPVDELKPHEKNRNIHPEAQIERLSKLIEDQGMRAPIVVSKRSGQIVKGHGTLLAIRRLGSSVAPVVYQDIESDDSEYRFLIGDNAISSWSELDLSGINTDLADIGPMEIDLLGLPDFTVDINEKPQKEKKEKAPKNCPHCGELLE